MFKFIYDGDNYRNELEFGDGECLTHDEVAEWFNQFLRGCGYRFDGEYGLVTPEEEQWLAIHEREKARDAFIQRAFEDETSEE